MKEDLCVKIKGTDVLELCQNHDSRVTNVEDLIAILEEPLEKNNINNVRITFVLIARGSEEQIEIDPYDKYEFIVANIKLDIWYILIEVLYHSNYYSHIEQFYVEDILLYFENIDDKILWAMSQ